MGNQQEGHLPPQHQDTQPGRQTEMKPQPQIEDPDYRGSGKLLNRVAIVTGGDSGIGQAVALAFAKEGADLSLVYLEEHDDARNSKKRIEDLDRRCIALVGDVSDSSFCKRAVQETVDRLGRLDILINNAGVQYTQEDFVNITDEQLERTFRTNIFSMFYMVRASLKHMKGGGAIVNTTSITAYRGSSHLIDYSSTKGAIVSFTRSLSLALIDRGIRVNAVAPGPVWTPLIPASFEEEKVRSFGENVPMRREAQPYEIATCYVFLASSDSSYISGQTLHPNGGWVVNG